MQKRDFCHRTQVFACSQPTHRTSGRTAAYLSQFPYFPPCDGHNAIVFKGLINEILKFLIYIISFYYTFTKFLFMFWSVGLLIKKIWDIHIAENKSAWKDGLLYKQMNASL